MANINAPDIATPETKALPRLAQGMAYSQPVNSGSYNTTATYRLGRGFPFFRRGVAVSAIPKFKGLTLYSHTTNTPAPFQTTQTGKNIIWPVPPR